MKAAVERAAPAGDPPARLRLRRAVPADVDAIWTLKRRLHIAPGQGPVVRDGFVLGVSRARYAELIAHANVLVLERAHLVGFSVTLPDHVLRATDVWRRRAAIEWYGQPPPISRAGSLDDARVGYFDQLACLPGVDSRFGAPALALSALLDLLATEHQHVFATVVREPVHNPAALRMLHAIGARLVGRLAERHEDVGALVSDVYHLDRSGRPPAPWADTALGLKIQRMIARARGS